MNNHDLICFSHLRWNFVFQRPQHLLTRFSKERRVYYVEEPVLFEGEDCNQVRFIKENLWVVVPYLKRDVIGEGQAIRLERLLGQLLSESGIERFIFWYYTPMALQFTESFNPSLVVYDCMDELSAFKFAPPEIKEREEMLLKKADLVFTGGHSLYEAKKHLHHQMFPFPSSIDKEHFSTARIFSHDPLDQESIPHPRIGFYGVIDERMNLELIAKVAVTRPDWHFVVLGPVVKIDESALPRYENIHYLGSKSYDDLPRYLAGWDIAIIPFSLNDSTRFISPTKTPEYLAAGKPVISSSIQDVINPYGQSGLVHIADSPEDFIAAASREFSNVDKEAWLEKVDAFLTDNSWENTWNQMRKLIGGKLGGFEEEGEINNLNLKEYVYV